MGLQKNSKHGTASGTMDRIWERRRAQRSVTGVPLLTRVRPILLRPGRLYESTSWRKMVGE